MTVVNLTPHKVVVMDEDRNELHTYPASGEVLRLATIELGTQNYPDVEVPVELVEYHHLMNPPKKIPGTWYLVSLPCALAYPRDDFLVPFLELRDDQGRIVGCRMLGRPV